MANRFEQLTDKERALLSTGIVCMLRELKKAPARTLANIMPDLARMMDELAETFDVPGPNKDLVARYIAHVDQQAAAEQADHARPNAAE